MTGFEPAASTSRTYEQLILTDNSSEVAATDKPVCTSVCTKVFKNSRKVSAPTSYSATIDFTKEGLAESSFAATLEMIAKLPLSDVERAEAVRRMLREG